MVGVTSCPYCIFDCETTYEFNEHKKTRRHYFNYKLAKLPQERKKKVHDRHKVKVEVASPIPIKVLRDGTVETMVDPSIEEVTFTFKASHTRSESVSLVRAYMLHAYPSFSLDDCLGVTREEGLVQLTPNSGYPITMQFKSPGIGIYEMPLYMQFEYQPKKSRHRMQSAENNGRLRFDIVRIMVINVMDMQEREVADVAIVSPFQREIWRCMEPPIPGTQLDGRIIRECMDYIIPEDLYQFLTWKMKENDRMNHIQFEQFHYLKHLLDDDLTMETYQERMHLLVYWEEHDGILQMENYNMSNVSMRIIRLDGGQERVELEVPGLAEKRPSIIKGDTVYARICYEAEQRSDVIPFLGQVVQLHDKGIWLAGFHPRLMHFLDMNPSMKFDIHFKFNRIPIALMHRAIDLIVQENLGNVVFPERVPGIHVRTVNVHNLRLENRLIDENPEQVRAIEQIILGTSRPAPYIIFGPPGTGKTVTLVEAIMQVKKVLTKSRTLVCSSSNAACDLLAERLLPYCNPNEILRLHSSSRDWKTVPEVLHNISNHIGEEYYNLKPRDLQKFSIIVCTLCAAGRLVPTPFTKDYMFTHVFIDECGQAKEPEAIIAIGGILQPPSRSLPAGGQLILAGDPKQLGPVCNSQNTKEWLGVSLLERLMATCPLYQPNKRGDYNNCFITKLILNFRSHPNILKLPNEIFYDDDLVANCGDDVLNDPLLTMPLEQYKKGGAAVRFHGVLGTEKREGRSPSFFNTHEINQVLKYVKSLLSPQSRVQVPQSDIGIISPYIRQVYKLKAALGQMKFTDIEVGTTETFQGREKRVIIISTVRSQKNFLHFDRKFQIGFLDNPKRFNVAVTRACSLLIVIGNPHLLDQDDNWKRLIDHCCKNLKSYVGCVYYPRNTQFMEHVLSKMESVVTEN